MKYIKLLLPLSFVVLVCASGCDSKNTKQQAHTDSFDDTLQAIMPEAESKPKAAAELLDYLGEEAQMPAKQSSSADMHMENQSTDEDERKVEEPIFYSLFKENITTTSLNIRKKPKAPERQGITYISEYDGEHVIDISSEDYDAEATYIYSYPLYGAVRCLEDYSFESPYYFNRRGDIESHGLICSDGQDPSERTYDYNSRGQLVKEVEWCHRENIGLGTYAWSETEYKYDKRGNIVESKYWSMPIRIEKMTKYTNKYDSKGRVVKTTYRQTEICNSIDIFERDPEIKSQSENSKMQTWKYDARGNVVENVAYDEGGAITYKYTWKYDAKGNQLEEAKYDERGALVSKSISKYDLKGNRVEISYHGFDGPQSKKLMYYSADNILVLTEECDAKDAIEKIIMYSYDKYGNIIKKREFDSSYSVTSERSFKYDRMGNVIEVCDAQDTVRYKITYYK